LNDLLEHAAQVQEAPRDSLTLLRHPATIRARCRAVLAAVDDERSPWFRLDRSRLSEVAQRVATLTRRRFPDLKVPPHSRWRHAWPRRAWPRPRAPASTSPS
jgi:hypothetical protein